MTELWIPQPNKRPDVANIYDMMLVFQEQLDGLDDRSLKINAGRIAVNALSANIDKLDEGQKQVTVFTDLAILDSTEGVGKGAIVESVGMRGMIDTVHCINIGETLPLAVSIGLDVISLFPHDNPEATDYVMTRGKAPIGRVHYIETLAS